MSYGSESQSSILQRSEEQYPLILEDDSGKLSWFSLDDDDGVNKLVITFDEVVISVAIAENCKTCRVSLKSTADGLTFTIAVNNDL